MHMYILILMCTYIHVYTYKCMKLLQHLEQQDEKVEKVPGYAEVGAFVFPQHSTIQEFHHKFDGEERKKAEICLSRYFCERLKSVSTPRICTDG